MTYIRSVLLAVVVGCGLTMVVSPANAADGKVSGVVTVSGKPLADGKVVFHLANGQFVGSKVKDGKYAIDRVPAGTRKVTVEGKGVPAKYTDDETSPLTVEVKDGDGTYDIDLK
jgi:hypothetical protein